ncbi:MAG: 4-hydroxythreonine-4-phosphate dehydrogenase PdxA [Rhodospirillales bacterium RIFCSPLOWO2_12_FULL_67_15]|nr:MAG: 4-hydroxythreonine-4-phosphate dehydrogenase PdxA [Rhodospirillales bacterium RIFCSPLOWO2_12_FULL_67_15]
MGEPAGIGGEIALKAWFARARDRLPPFFVIDDPERLSALARRLALAVPVKAIAGPEDARAVFRSALPVLPEPLPKAVEPGRPDAANGVAVCRSIERAVELVQAGRAAALVTNPIHKASLYQGGFLYAGHTEFLAALARVTTPPVMMLACDTLRVVPVTIHVSLVESIRALTTEAIVTKAAITAKALARDFGIRAPRLAIAGLNPHAGEGARLGTEEETIIRPAIERLRARGIEASGPWPPDTMFAPAARATYDAAICMYHDQALIPIKTIAFDEAVNLTLGLPFVRTSPDHGTAFDIAGTGKARPQSLIAAIRMAARMVAMRARVDMSSGAGAAAFTGDGI